MSKPIKKLTEDELHELAEYWRERALRLERVLVGVKECAIHAHCESVHYWQPALKIIVEQCSKALSSEYEVN